MVRLAGRHDWNEWPVGVWIANNVPQPWGGWILSIPGRVYVITPLWLLGVHLAASVDLGVAFTVVSLLILMYFNTTTEERAKDSLSAYSVFNKNQTRILGTTDPDAIDRELRGKMY